MHIESKLNPTPTVEPSLGEKAKKPFGVALVLGVAFSALVLPRQASASFFSDVASFLQTTAPTTEAASSPSNSQTMALLTPAVNINPNPSVGGGDISLVGGSALLPQDGPSGTAADIEMKPTTSQISVYTVRPGDTLSEISKMFGVSVNTIVLANDIKGGVIHPGDSLIILPITGLQHTVIKGETLASLAKTYKADAHEIAQYNDLADGASLSVGDTVIIPNGDTGPAVSQIVSSGTSKTKTTKITKFVPARLRGTGGPDMGSYFAWPVGGGAITQSLHGLNAVDIGAAKGTDIYAAADGVVIIARFNGAWNGGYGNYIVIQHDNGTQTLYGHASKILVSAGDTVSQGDLIGKVGSTGESTGPHLHFEVRGAKNPFGDLPLGATE